eukprot:1161696-Pelagomonas_calceolata.AAC.5
MPGACSMQKVEIVDSTIWYLPGRCLVFASAPCCGSALCQPAHAKPASAAAAVGSAAAAAGRCAAAGRVVAVADAGPAVWDAVSEDVQGLLEWASGAWQGLGVGKAGTVPAVGKAGTVYLLHVHVYFNPYEFM